MTGSATIPVPTLWDLATRVGVPRKIVEACLKGKVPEAEVLYLIAKALDSTMESLLTGEGQKHPRENLEFLEP